MCTVSKFLPSLARQTSILVLEKHTSSHTHRVRTIFLSTEFRAHITQILSYVNATLLLCYSTLYCKHFKQLTHGPFRLPREVVGWLDDCSWLHLPAGCLLHPPCLFPDQTPGLSLRQQSHRHQAMTTPQHPDCCRHLGPGWTAGVEDSEAGWEFPEPLPNTTHDKYRTCSIERINICNQVAAVDSRFTLLSTNQLDINCCRSMWIHWVRSSFAKTKV